MTSKFVNNYEIRNYALFNNVEKQNFIAVKYKTKT